MHGTGACFKNQSYSGRWFSNSSEQRECVTPFYGVLVALGPVVHWIDAPCIALAMMGFLDDAVHGGVAHVKVRRCHVYFCPEGTGAVRKLPFAHALEQIEVLHYGAVAIRAFFSRLRKRAPVLAHLVGRKVAHVCRAGLYHVHRPLVHLLEVIGRIIEVLSPVVAEPPYVLLDGVHIFLVFLARVGVVVA